MKEEQIKHLEMIQAVITRMASNSFAIKGWTITLVSAILVVAHEIAGWPYLLIALIPAIVFWGLDAYYLRLERIFRKLYDTIRLQQYNEWGKDPFTFDISTMRNQVKNWFVTCWATCNWLLYVPLIITIAVVTLYTAKNNSQLEDNSNNGKKSVLQLPLQERQLESSPDSQSLGN